MAPVFQSARRWFGDFGGQRIGRGAGVSVGVAIGSGSVSTGAIVAVAGDATGISAPLAAAVTKSVVIGWTFPVHWQDWPTRSFWYRARNDKRLSKSQHRCGGSQSKRSSALQAASDLRLPQRSGLR